VRPNNFANCMFVKNALTLPNLQFTGFPMVFEQFDHFGPDIVGEITAAWLKHPNRGMFVGVKDQAKGKL
jgi:hypothetical protein